MPDQLPTPTLKGLRRIVLDKEHELAELDLMFADYHGERCRLIRKLSRVRGWLRDAEEAAWPKVKGRQAS